MTLFTLELGLINNILVLVKYQIINKTNKKKLIHSTCIAVPHKFTLIKPNTRKNKSKKSQKNTQKRKEKKRDHTDDNHLYSPSVLTQADEHTTRSHICVCCYFVAELLPSRWRDGSFDWCVLV